MSVDATLASTLILAKELHRVTVSGAVAGDIL
jgi:hypothetical protein